MTRGWPSVLVMVAASAAAISFSYDIEMRNDLSSTVLVELKQYGSDAEDGSRPRAWSEDLLLDTVSGDLVPGEKDTTTFSTAGGGFWVVWVVRDYGTGRVRCTGEIAWGEKKSRFSIVIGQSNCGTLE